MFQSEKSKELYAYMVEEGYPEDFSRAVSRALNTDFTAKRMLGYLSYYSHLPLEEVADEMLAILSDREAWIQKKTMENNQAAWNRHMEEGFDE